MRASLSDTRGVQRANKPIVEAVVRAVATVEGVDPVDLSDPVFAFIDPDALDAVVTSAGGASDLTVSFQAWEHEIVVTGDGAVLVDGEVRERAPIRHGARDPTDYR